VIDSARWTRVKQLFYEAEAVPESQREAWLTIRCADDAELMRELHQLLADDGMPNILDESIARALHSMDSDRPVDAQLGRQIGVWRLVRRIGEGGMGSVYLAERQRGDFAQQVALKLIRSELVDARTIERFAQERSVLARLNHPNIAQLHDGGVSDDGQPYFTMEYVEGEAITHYCDARALGVHARVELVLQVCAAIAYAHRNLVVHRDLKPSNILVNGEGAVKLLDFGIAKTLHDDPDTKRTATQARLMTPEYAAPEQVLGEPITTATDVYAIGVLLYELLSGRLPYVRADAGAISWSKAVIEEPPEAVWRAPARVTGRRDAPAADMVAHRRDTTLSALRRSLRGDLDNILQRALAKPADARYHTVSLLQDDLSAYLAGQAISGGTRTYRFRKFARLHWLPLCAGALLLLILATSAAMLAIDRSTIERESRRTTVVKDFLFGLFGAIDPAISKDMDITARELLERGKQDLERNPPDDPLIKAELQAVLGRIDDHLGLFASANGLQRMAVDAFVAHGGSVIQRVTTELEHVQTLIDMEDANAAGERIVIAAADLAAVSNPPVEVRLLLSFERAQIGFLRRQLDEARRDALDALALARRPGGDPAILVRTLKAAGNIEWARHSIDEAESDYREALGVALRFYDPAGPQVASIHGNLALVQSARSHYADALSEVDQVIAIYTPLFGPNNMRTLQFKVNKGAYLFHLGHYREARSLLEDSLEKQRAQLGPGSSTIGGALINLGLVCTESPDLDSAERSFVEAVGIFETKYNSEHAGAREALGDLAYVHMLQGHLERAEEEFTKLWEIGLKVHGAGETRLYWWGEIARRRGDLPHALERTKNGLEKAQAEGENNRLAAVAHYYRALTLRDSGDKAGAVAELRASLASFAGYLPGADHPMAATVRLVLASLLSDSAAARGEVADLMRDALDIRTRFLGPDDPLTAQARAAAVRASVSSVISR
jgi:eukaryotic-like serine/threonine-protein kinase